LYYNKFTYINQQRRRLGRILIIYPDAARASPVVVVAAVLLLGCQPAPSSTPGHHSTTRHWYILQAIVYNYISSSVQGRCVYERKGYYATHLLAACRRSLASRAHYSYSRRRIIYPYPRLCPYTIYIYIDRYVCYICVCVHTKANIYIYLYVDI